MTACPAGGVRLFGKYGNRGGAAPADLLLPRSITCDVSVQLL